jgi:uncharacterized phage protein gp47/JayE
MTLEDLRKLDQCGCCQAPVPPTPEEVTNRPGLPAIRYRIGTYSSFRQAMIEKSASLPVEVDGRTFHPLRGWTTRASDDYGVALLEMWSYLADILTFYQERIANEAFLRTALLPESVRRLAALLAYEPAPGVAATVHLAFTLEKGKQVRIPTGLRVQTVPGQDEKPQKFEVVEDVAADARLNRVRVFPVVKTDTPLAEKDRDWAILRPDGAGGTAADLAPGDRLVFFATENSAKVEEKIVEAVGVTDTGVKLLWSPPMRDALDGGRIFKWKRQFRLFGYNAPESYMKPVVDSASGEVQRWKQVKNTDPDYPKFGVSGHTLQLDALYDDLKVGTQVLVVAPDSPEPANKLARIQKVERTNQAKGPLSDTVTQITLSEPDKADKSATVDIADLRTATVYELDEEIKLWDHRYEDVLAKDTDTAFMLLPQPEALARGHVLVLDDAKGKPQMVTCTGVDRMPAGGGIPERLRITFTPKLQRDLDTETSVLYGNVVLATHGETVAREVLGDGDASSAFQSFGIRKSPVTFVPRPGAPGGAGSTLQVRVGGVLWEKVNALYGHGGQERVYTARVDDEGVTTLRFGDGVTGARLPSGRDNVVASYRQGLGRDGNVGANSLTTLLDRPVGLKGVTNPVEAEGGADPETLQESRANAPNTVRTFERVVSLRDFEDAAREFVGVAKARATWKWNGEEQVVCLTVAGDGGDEVGEKTRESLRKDLNSRRDPNRELEIASYCRVPVQVEASIKVRPDRVPEEVRAAAQEALEAFFAFENLEIGQWIHLSDIYRTLQGVEGVVAADIDHLAFKPKPAKDGQKAGTSEEDTTNQVKAHLRIDPTKMAFIEQSTTDAVVRVRVGEP